MTESPLVQAIQERLRTGGYSDLTTPLRMAGVEFAFTGAMRGSGGRALDLVLLVDTTTGDFGDRDAGRVRHRVEALSRALDVTGSRYVISAILAGAVLADGIETLSETCRVLQVDGIPLNADGKPADEIAERQLDDRIRVLLPLTLPDPIAPSQNGGGPAMDQLVHALPASMNRALIDAVIASSERGEQAVTDVASSVIGAVFLADIEEEAS